MNEPGFRNDKKRATTISKDTADLKEEVDIWEGLMSRAEDLYNLTRELDEAKDYSLKEELERKFKQLDREFSKAEASALLAGEHDRANAVMSIHAGAGGTDAQDWAEMLLRMYMRYAEKKKWDVNLVDKSEGSEAGIKSVVFEVTGKNAYGLLKSEAGVHRLVRISPFDAEKMRHTSFAMVEVMPEMEELEIEVNEDRKSVV